MKRQRSNSIDLFDQTHSGLSPSRSSVLSGGGGGPRSDAGGDAHSVASGGAGGGGGGGAGVLDEAMRQKFAHAERMKIALLNMSEEQKDRFEFFRRSHFNREAIKKMMTDAFVRVRVLNMEGYAEPPPLQPTQPARAGAAAPAAEEKKEEEKAKGARELEAEMNDQMVIVVGALCKMFVGDLVHGARQVMDERDEEGAIKPHHLREAHRRAVKEKRLPVMRPLPPAPAPTPPKP